MRRALFVAVMAVALMGIRCGDTIVTIPTAPQEKEKAPEIIRTTIEFRVVGNASAVRVRYSAPQDGLTQVITSLPYSSGFTTTSESMFLSLEALPIAYPLVLNFPFLSVQIVAGGNVFREASSNEFILNPLLISGTWRR
jgi:hypothetical protein